MGGRWCYLLPPGFALDIMLFTLGQSMKEEIIVLIVALLLILFFTSGSDYLKSIPIDEWLDLELIPDVVPGPCDVLSAKAQAAGKYHGGDYGVLGFWCLSARKGCILLSEGIGHVNCSRKTS